MEGASKDKKSLCTRFDSELDAYLEGESRPFVTSHAQDCLICGGVLLDLEHLRAAARDLPLEDPSPAVWANIRAALVQEGALSHQPKGWRKFLDWQFLPHPAPAAVLAGLFAIGLILTTPSGSLLRRNPATTALSSSNAKSAFVALSSEDNALAQLVDELESTFQANQARLAPDMKATYQKSLESLNTSIQECLVSLREQPDNRLAHDYLLTAYTRKAEVLSSALEYEGR